MVDFRPSEEQEMIRETVASFAREELRPRARDADEACEIPASVIDKGWELGLIQSIVPEQYGGFGSPRSAVTGALVAEELAWGDLSIALHLLAPRLLVQPLLDFGTDAQKERYLQHFHNGRFHAATAAVMEPRFDFDLTALTTRAVRSGDDYVLTGSKCYVPLGSQAETFLIYAATDPGAGYRGVDGFLMDRGAAGLVLGEPEKNMGLRALDTVELELDACRVPATNRLGGEQGADFQRIIDANRLALAAMAVGVAKAAYEYAREYAKERHAFGRPIARNQSIAFMLAEMAMEIDAARLLLWEAAWKFDRGENVLRDSYLAKRYAADAALKVADNAVQVLGGHGYIREHPVEMWLRNARGFAIFEGLATV
jgi:acyl-CoA dehydrogenase